MTQKRIIAFAMAALLLTGCSACPESAAADTTTVRTLPTETTEADRETTAATQAPLIAEEAAVLQAEPAIVHTATCVAPGELVEENNSAVIDYSNTEEGYVMVCYTAETDRRLKVQVKGPAVTYTYNLIPGKWAAFPLSDENGTYKITVYENVEGSKYATVLSLTTDVTMENEFAPFLHANQYVDFDAAPGAVAKADALCAGLETLEKVAAVYDFVVKGMSYDWELAASVQTGYLPDLDRVLEKMSGICFDYAALMTGMLRSQGVPCKLVVGYAGEVYHAWISVWSKETGWIEGIVFFDGVSWQRMDPTFAASAEEDPSILNYIGDGSHYHAKYIY